MAADREQVLADYIKRTVDAAPPLTPEQKDRLAVALRSGRPHFKVSDPITVRIKA